MKKTLLCALFATLALFVVVGCDHKKNDDGISINKDNLFTLKGNYEIEAVLMEPRFIETNQAKVAFAKNCEAFSAVSQRDCSLVTAVDFAGQASFDGANAESMVFQTKLQMWGNGFNEGINTIETVNKMTGFDLYFKYNYMKTKPLIKFAGNQENPGFITIANFDAKSGRDFDRALTDAVGYNAIIILLPGNRLYVAYSTQVPVIINGEQLTKESPTYLFLKKVSNTPIVVDSNVLLDPATTPGYDGTGFKTNAEIGYDPDAASTLQ